MIDYLNPSRISANPPEGSEKNCTANCKKTAPSGDYADTTQDYTDKEGSHV